MKKKILLLASSSLLLLASCGGSTPAASSSSGYNSEWKPGEKAIEGAVQPSVKNPTGTVNELGQLRNSQGKKGLPQKGDANLLVVPLSFTDDANYGTTITKGQRVLLEDAYFSQDETKALPSVSQYYAASSYGALNLSGVLAPTVTVEKTFVDYLYDCIDFGIENPVKAITDYVYSYLFEETETYYAKDFDADKDGKIDGIVLAYSWFPAAAYANYSIYSYLAQFLVNETFFGQELDLNSPVNSVTWTSAKISDLTGSVADSHMYIRETGKMLGLESYADQTGNSEGTYRAPVAHRDMMDGSIGDHNPFSKYQLGWIEPNMVTADNLSSKQTTYTLKPYEESGDTLLLAPSATGRYGEYLLVEYYTPTGLNAYDVNSDYPYNLYGNNNYSKPGIRVYKVDARLVEGSSSSSVSVTNEDPDYTKTHKMKDGSVVNAYYDFAYGNSSVNEYEESGVYEDYPLVEELSKKGFNRHMVTSTFALTDDDMFLAGDTFGGEDSIPGFYSDFALDGNGYGNKKLGIEFSVDSLNEEGATLSLWRAE